VITIEGKNHYEYLVFEDLKPAGFEAVAVRSGQSLYAKELKRGAVERKAGQASSRSSNQEKDPRKSSGTVLGTKAGGGSLKTGRTPMHREQVPVLHSTDYTGRSRWVYQELRDRKVAMFIDKLPEGVWELRYDLRAEVPGEFHALPVLGHAMYVPEIRCNGDETRVTVNDRE